VADVGSGKDTWKATEHQDAVNAMYGHLALLYSVYTYMCVFMWVFSGYVWISWSHPPRHSEPSQAISPNEAGWCLRPFDGCPCAGWTMNSTYSLEHSLLVSADDAGVVKLWDTR
jgi:hypothetical protein